jgi:hypothetical protein
MFVESFDLSPSNQYILVRVIPSCFCFTKMCLCQASLLSRLVRDTRLLLFGGVAHCQSRWCVWQPLSFQGLCDCLLLDDRAPNSKSGSQNIISSILLMLWNPFTS